MKTDGRSVICVATLLALGCASCIGIDRREFPTDWPAVKNATEGCPDLTGSYANADRGSPSVALASWILPKTTLPLEKVERVRISGPADGNVAIHLTDASNTDVATRELKQGTDYRCANGWLVLTLEGFLAPLPAVVHSAEARLSRTVDGELVVDNTETTTGVVIFVPGYATKTRWHLYPLASG